MNGRCARFDWRAHFSHLTRLAFLIGLLRMFPLIKLAQNASTLPSFCGQFLIRRAQTPASRIFSVE